jgi:MFS family permease
LLAGGFIVLIGPFGVLFADAATFALSAVLVWIGVPQASGSHRGGSTPPTSYGTELSAGLRFLVGNRLIFSMLVLALVGNFFDVPLLSVVLPVYASEVFGSSTSLGIMLSAFAAGAMGGTILFGAVGMRLPRRRIFLCGWLLAVLIAYGALAAQLPLAGIVLAAVAAGLLAGPINPILETVVQEHTPPELMGRVFGAFIAFAQAGIPLGAALAGLVIEGAGLLQTIAVVGALYVVLIGLMFFNPALRGMDVQGATARAAPTEPMPTEASPQARQSATMKAGL